MPPAPSVAERPMWVSSSLSARLARDTQHRTRHREPAQEAPMFSPEPEPLAPIFVSIFSAPGARGGTPRGRADGQSLWTYVVWAATFCGTCDICNLHRAGYPELSRVRTRCVVPVQSQRKGPTTSVTSLLSPVPKNLADETMRSPTSKSASPTVPRICGDTPPFLLTSTWR